MPRWDKILVHHSASPDKPGYLDYDSIYKHHVTTNGWKDIGYHFVVELAGKSYRAIAGRPLTQAGAHCPGQNEKAIGICFVGNFMESEPPQGQLEEGARLIAGLCQLGRISPEEIYPHGKFRSTECPGTKFPLEKLRGMVERLL